jgi:hypothetical protein
VSEKARELFEGRLFDIEHALDLYALSYAQLPASEIYNDAALAAIKGTVERCHIYFVCLAPKVDFMSARQETSTLVLTFQSLGETYELSWPMPKRTVLKEEEGWFIEWPDGRRGFPPTEDIMYRFHTECKSLDFDVQYIGQAFGSSGERHALDRLLKHETLQKISLLGVPEGYRLELILAEVEPSNKLITSINPFADNVDDSDERIRSGLDKLFGTNYAEMVCLYEAAMIRYFEPKYNVEFVNSFPSTNLKILSDCYDKDIAAIVAEFCFDGLPFHLYSHKAKPRAYHIAQFNLHSKNERDFFFGMGPSS